MEEPTNTRRLIPVTKWGDDHSWPSVSGLRHLIFYRDTNGFAMCVVKLGRNVLIDEKKFFEWVDAHNQFKIAS